jgi:hypothetical protein
VCRRLALLLATTAINPVLTAKDKDSISSSEALLKSKGTINISQRPALLQVMTSISARVDQALKTGAIKSRKSVEFFSAPFDRYTQNQLSKLLVSINGARN